LRPGPRAATSEALVTETRRSGWRDAAAVAFDGLATTVAPTLSTLLAWQTVWSSLLAPRPQELFPDVTLPVMAARGRRRTVFRWRRDFTPRDGAASLLLAVSPRPVARWYPAEGPRLGHTLVVVSGFNMGWPRFDARLLALRRLQRAGFDVALLGLPLHGMRTPWLAPPAWPWQDVGLTVQALACAVYEARQLVAWLRQRDGQPVSMLGLSLGAWVGALVCTLPRPPEALVAVTPLVDLPALLLDHTPPFVLDALVSPLRDALRPVSPLARPPTLPPLRTLVLAAELDRVTNPVKQAAPLARHFQGELRLFPGSHLLPYGLGQAYQELTDFLAPEKA
jgi:hypothetical protein